MKIRTSNLLIRSQMLYPVELRALSDCLLAEVGGSVKLAAPAPPQGSARGANRAKGGGTSLPFHPLPRLEKTCAMSIAKDFRDVTRSRLWLS